MRRKMDGLLHDKTIIDATSGNTGIAYAALGTALGYKVTLCLPANATEERKKLIRLYGAEIIETDPLESSDGAYNEYRRLVAEHPEKYFYPDQYNNDANWKAHFEGTAAEIWEQTDHRVTHFVAGTGTSGTFMGTSRGLKHFNPEIKSVLMTVQFMSTPYPSSTQPFAAHAASAHGLLPRAENRRHALLTVSRTHRPCAIRFRTVFTCRFRQSTSVLPVFFSIRILLSIDVSFFAKHILF